MSFLTRARICCFDSDMVNGLYTTMIKILVLYLDFEGAKNINVLKGLICSFVGCWRSLIGVWHLDLDLDMVTGL